MVSLWVPVLSQGPECVFVHFDKPLYGAGETIWFKVYQFGQEHEARSRVLHVDLVTHQNNLVARQKLLIHERSSFGSITLPMDAPEGYYRFRAYTHYNLNFNPPMIYQARIPIYSPGNDDIPSESYPARPPTAASGSMGITVTTDKKTYQPRDSIVVSFEVNSTSNLLSAPSISVSVIPSDLVSYNFESFREITCPEMLPDTEPLILPERALYMKGKLVDPESGEPVSSRLLSVYVDRTSQLIRASSLNGTIKVAVPDYRGLGVFQVLNLDPYNPLVPEFIPENLSAVDDPYYNPSPPPRSARVLRYLDQLQKRRKVVELFNLYNRPEVEKDTTDPKVPDAIYRSADFKQIYTFEQFINEAIQNVRVREVDGTKTVRLFNREQGRLFEDHPWYIVDGFLTYNEEEVLQIAYQDIVEVRLFYKTSTLDKNFQGFMLRSGIMEITTRDVKYVRELKDGPNVVEIQGFTTPTFFMDHINLSRDKNVPDFRGTLYWSPVINRNTMEKRQITIPLSDDTGNFTVVMMGTDHQRQPIVGYETIEVKMK